MIVRISVLLVGLMLVPFLVLGQLAVDYGDLGCYQVAMAALEPGVYLGTGVDAETEPLFEDSDPSDNGQIVLEYGVLYVVVSPGARTPGHLLSVFADTNRNCRFEWAEALLLNFPVEQLVFDGDKAVVPVIHPRDVDNLALRAVLGTTPLTPLIVNSQKWDVGTGEVEDVILNPRQVTTRPNVNLPAPTQTPPNDTGEPPPDDDGNPPPTDGGNDDNDNPPPDCHATNTCPPDDDDGDNDHCNAGGGNGAEPDENGDDCDPGNSGDHNNADDEDDDDNDHGGGGGHDNDGCNSGNGNGDEDCDPGNSEDHNNGGDEDSPNPGKGK